MIILWWVISEIAFEDPRPNDTVCHRLSLPAHPTLLLQNVENFLFRRMKNDWDWPSMEWQGWGVFSYDTINKEYNINTLLSEFASHTMIIMTISLVYSRCHESLLLQRESFDRDREKAITKRRYLEERPPWWQPDSHWVKHFDVESKL